MNKIVIAGRLTKDPEMSQTSSGLVYCRFTVACKSKMKDEEGNAKTDFFLCVAWREKAEVIGEYCNKGSLVQVSGAMNSRTYEYEGEKKLVWECNVDDVEFLSSKSDNEAESKPKGSTKKSKSSKSQQVEMEPIDDDGLPF